MSQLHPDIRRALDATLKEQTEQLLELWMEQQLSSDSLRLDLIDESLLREESEQFLHVLKQCFPQASTMSLDDPAWEPIIAYLREISENRDLSGFAPSETALFVLSLKEPLMSLINAQADGSKDEIVIPARVWWHIVLLFDQMALFTTEAYQKRREATIERQREEMEELSTPVVKIWDGILAIPLIGTLDTRRSQMVTEALLEALNDTGSEIAILDLTGVPAVDTRMAQHLLRTIAAARLMGADCILSGIRPQIAQTIVHLQINLGDITTESTLAAALKTAFRRIDLQVSTKGSSS